MYNESYTCVRVWCAVVRTSSDHWQLRGTSQWTALYSCSQLRLKWANSVKKHLTSSRPVHMCITTSLARTFYREHSDLLPNLLNTCLLLPGFGPSVLLSVQEYKTSSPSQSWRLQSLSQLQPCSWVCLRIKSHQDSTINAPPSPPSKPHNSLDILWPSPLCPTNPNTQPCAHTALYPAPGISQWVYPSWEACADERREKEQKGEERGGQMWG